MGMTRSLAGVAAAMAWATATIRPVRAQQLSCAPDSAFHRVVADLQARQQNVGTSIAVSADGRVVYSELMGLADREANHPVTPESRFGIASITKAFTGVALLKLYEQGRVDLDAPIQRYVPDFPRHPAGVVTLRHLAAHLGGVRHWGPERNHDLYARHFDDVRDILALFRDSAYVLPPGQRYSYSSYGYNLLAMAIQVASGMPFTRYVETTVIRPLGLQATAYDDPRQRRVTDARRYSWYDLQRFSDTEVPVLVPDWDYSHNMGGGNMVSTTADLIRLGRAVRSPGLLGPGALELLHTRPVLNGVESGMSFGWFVRNTPPRRLVINGSNAGLQAGLVAFLDRDLVVAVLTNTWGKGSRSGEFASDASDGLMGKLAALCH
jgi:CubicO group peptidase (beta-lactamase class C family)